MGAVTVNRQHCPIPFLARAAVRSYSAPRRLTGSGAGAGFSRSDGEVDRAPSRPMSRTWRQDTERPLGKVYSNLSECHRVVGLGFKKRPRLRGPAVRFHALRHNHASALISSGVDVLTVNRRLGHGTPVVTLTTYAHLFEKTDQTAAKAIEAALRSSKER